MRVYCGIDLHSTNSHLAVLDETRQTILSRKLPNRLEAVLGCLEPYREQLVAVRSNPPSTGTGWSTVSWTKATRSNSLTPPRSASMKGSSSSTTGTTLDGSLI